MNRKKLIREQLDVSLDRFTALSSVSPPHKGWIRAIRDALGMTAKQLARRLGVAQQAVARIERDELAGSVSIKTMRRVAESLDCVFVCGFAPRSSLEKTVRRQAQALASKRLARASQTMALEDQALSEEENGSALAKMVDEIVDALPQTYGTIMIKCDYPEGATPPDADEAEGLLLTHITTCGELDRWEQDNIVEALTWLAQAQPTDILNEPFIKKLHGHMFGDVWKWAGHFRHSDKNIGGPWYQVPASLKDLCDDTRLWIELQEESSDEMGVRFHHRLVSIHPFPNGNGRHARLMTDILLENAMGCPRFSWGSKNLSKPGDTRHQYIAALQAADSHNYGLLLEFVRT